MGKYLSTRGRSVVAQNELLSISRYNVKWGDYQMFLLFIYIVLVLFFVEIFVKEWCMLAVEDLFTGTV